MSTHDSTHPTRARSPGHGISLNNGVGILRNVGATEQGSFGLSSAPISSSTPLVKSDGVIPATQINRTLAVRTTSKPASSTVTKIGKADIAKLFWSSSPASTLAPSLPSSTNMPLPQMQPPMEGQSYADSGWYMPQIGQTPPQRPPSDLHIQRSSVAADPPSSDLSTIQNPPSALATARKINDLGSVPYPEGIKTPSVELNIGLKDGQFRYDREFLLQFMSICKEKPEMLPPLDAIGLEPSESSYPMSLGGSGRHRQTSNASPQRHTSVSGLPPGSFDKASFNPFRMRMVSFGTTSSKADECSDGPGTQVTNMSVAEAKEKIAQYSKEFFATRDFEVAGLYFVELPAVHHYLLVDDLVYSSVESSEADARLVGDFFADAASKGLCSEAAFEEGIAPTAEFLDDIALDAPGAPDLLAIMMKGAGLSDVRREGIASKSQEYCSKLLELSKPQLLPSSILTDSTFALMAYKFSKERQAQSKKELYQRQQTMSRGGSRRGGDRGDQQQVGPDGWTTAGSAPRAPPKAGDLSKFGQINKGSTAPLTFGPRSSIYAGKKDKRESILQTNSSSQSVFSMLQSAEASQKEYAQREKLVLAPRYKPTVLRQQREENAAPEMSAAYAKKKIEEDLREFFAARNLDKAEDYFSSLPAAHHHLLVDKLVSSAIESTQAEAQLVGDLFARASSKGLCTSAAFEQGIVPAAEFLDDTVLDAPKAPDLLAIMIKGARLSDAQRARIASKSEAHCAKLFELSAPYRLSFFSPET